MFHLLKKECKDLFDGWSAWALLVFYAMISITFLWVFPDSSYLTFGNASPELYFQWVSYSFLFLIPAITYGMFSQELRSGSLEILHSLPISKIEIVGSKYLAGFSFVFCVLILGIPTFWVLYKISSGTIDFHLGQLAGSYLGTLMVSGFFLSVGLFCSVLFKNIALSFTSAVVIGFAFYQGWDLLGFLDEGGSVDYFLSKMTIQYHMGYFSRGVITLSGIVYLVSVQLVFLFLCEWRLSNYDS